MKQGTLKVKVNDAEDALENNDCSSAGSGYYIRCSIGAVQRTARGQLRAIQMISCIKPVRKAALYQVAQRAFKYQVITICTYIGGLAHLQFGSN